MPWRFIMPLFFIYKRCISCCIHTTETIRVDISPDLPGLHWPLGSQADNSFIRFSGFIYCVILVRLSAHAVDAMNQSTVNTTDTIKSWNTSTIIPLSYMAFLAIWALTSLPTVYIITHYNQEVSYNWTAKTFLKKISGENCCSCIKLLKKFLYV